MKVFYDKDADVSLLHNRRIAVVGYGSQGHAQALNLRDSGANVVMGLRKGKASWTKAEAAGLSVMPVADAVREADLVVMLIPDESIAEVYAKEVEPALRNGAALVFAHGFNIHYGQVEPRADLDVFMVAPKAPGHTVRSTFVEGAGVPALIAVSQDVSGQAKALALAYATAIGCGRSGIIETDFREETETDLFGEQVVLCGGAVELIKGGFEVLVEAGYSPELAYFECLHELKLIVDLLYEGGVSTMNYSISNNAEFGEYLTGPKIVTEDTKNAMRDALAFIQDGSYAKAFILEAKSGNPVLTSKRNQLKRHQLEVVGAKLRAMMPWIKASALVDKTQN
ncbi:ketol-acid reductoisomerase [Pseudomonas sp. LRF_L74]|uniref:ketol-acid reductoisomerase n=1 Tax=Pseudomonas sp. LRF_L74 TaxID=3369422 RepID=UPI003F620B15